jgi:filamentous hemagglutinin
MGTGGIGFTIGSSKTTHDLREQGTTQSQSFSTVGSTGGNVSISAGKQLHVSGADLIAQRDISLTGDSVVIDPGQDKRTRDETFKQKSSGLTLALSGAAGSAINSAVQTAKDAKGESDSRLATLQATKAALSGVQAAQGVAVAQATGEPNNGFGVSISLTSQQSRSEQHAVSDTVAGSTLNAGGNLAITATGSDILIRGSQLKAAGDTALSAANDIVLSGAANTQQTTGKNSSSGGGVGVSIGGGTSGYGISVFANANGAKGNEKGDGTAWTETTVDSGGTVSLVSGRDTILNGAQVSGDRITADTGRDLWLSSQQDSNDYKSKQTSVAAGGSFTFGSMTGSGYASASQDKMKSNYDSVLEQTGLFAGDGGFDITTGRHTQLDGAVIASTATAENNRLDTGTLGFSDIHNEADFRVSHTGASFSGGGSFGDTFKGNMAGGMITAGGNSGHEEGTTRAAVAEGSLIVRDPAAQKQDVAGLSRDTAQANGSISQIFDKEKEQKRLQTISLIGDIAGQAADIARTQGELSALKEAKKTLGDLKPDATAKEREAWVKTLRESDAYKEEMKKYGTGSTLQRGIQAATAALQGLAGGDIGAALAGAAAPELANIIGHHAGIDDNTAAKTLAHAILGGVTAALQGNSAAAGASGAAAGELAAHAIAGMLYPDVKDLATLSEEQKQTVSMLSTISAGLAGGLAGDSTTSTAAGAQAGKTAVENNLLGGSEWLQTEKAREHGADVFSCSDNPSGEACKRGQAENKAYAGALATGSVALLPGSAQAMWLLGVGTNAGMQYADSGEINPVNSVAAGWINVITMGQGWKGTIAWNVAGGALTNAITGDDPLTGAITNGAGAGFGYGVGNYVVKPIANTAGKWITGGWNPKFDPTLLKYTEVKGLLGLSKEMVPSKIPSAVGNAGGSLTSEFGSSIIQKKKDAMEAGK